MVNMAGQVGRCLLPKRIAMNLLGGRPNKPDLLECQIIILSRETSSKTQEDTILTYRRV